MKSTRIKWRDRTPENDIKYGGFLSYRHLRIIGWACLIIAQISLILKLEAKLAPDTAGTIENWNLVISIFSGLPIPLFLLANLSTILQSRGNYKALFIRFGGLAVALYILANFLVFHYGYRTLAAINPSVNWGDAARIFGMLLPALGKTGYTLNIFIDMLLVVLMFFFMNYEPRRIFKGKGVIVFRLMILLPIAYEVAGIVLKYCLAMGIMEIPSPVFFLLPSKPPLIFAAFVAIVIGLKIAEIKYLRRPGNSKESFALHVTTKAHSLKISIGMATSFVVFAVIDIVLIIVLMLVTSNNVAAANPQLDKDSLDVLIWAEMQAYESIGIGEATGLILAAPLVLLFSYTKTHKNPKVDLFIPVAGIVLIILVLIEGNFQVITLNMSSFMEKLREALNRYFGNGDSEGGAKQAKALLSFIPYIHL